MAVAKMLEYCCMVAMVFGVIFSKFCVVARVFAVMGGCLLARDKEPTSLMCFSVLMFFNVFFF